MAEQNELQPIFWAAKRLAAADSDRRLIPGFLEIANQPPTSHHSRQSISSPLWLWNPATLLSPIGHQSATVRQLISKCSTIYWRLITDEMPIDRQQITDSLQGGFAEMISSMSTHFIKILFWLQNGSQPVTIRLQPVSEESPVGRRSL